VGRGKVGGGDREENAAEGMTITIESGWKATSAFLDGEANAVRGGWDCIGCGRTLFVPYYMASDAAAALLLCRQSGLLTKKLNAMKPARAWVTYLLTPPRPEPLN
jgi:hypothetical protein